MKNWIKIAVLVSFSFSLSSYSKTVVKPKPAGASPGKSTYGSSPVQESYFADFEYELQTALSRGGIETSKVGSDSVTTIEAQASITKVIRNNIQAGAEAHFFNYSGGGGSSYFEVMGVGIYNLDNNLKESLYGKVGLGMFNTINSSAKNEAKFGFMVGGGKRIPIMEKVAYTPEVRIVLVDGTTRFQILAINFSLFY